MGKQVQTGRRRGQRGMAMVMVLGVIAVTMLMVVHIMSICEIISRDAYVSAARMQQRYVAESAADHAFWMYLNDRRLYSNRSIGSEDEMRESNGFEGWEANRRPHEPFESNCQVYLANAQKTVNVTDSSTFSRYVDVDDTDTMEIIDDFKDILEDYTDSDSAVKLAGRENDDYAADGYASLPRNGAMQFAEEIFWLPGWQDVISGELCIIPPSGKEFSDSENEKTSFFTVSGEEIQDALDLSDEELEEVLAAREEYQEDGTELSTLLDADVYVNLQSAFSFTEADVLEFTASAATDDGSVRILFRETRGVNISDSSIYAMDGSTEAFSIWQRTIY